MEEINFLFPWETALEEDASMLVESSLILLLMMMVVMAPATLGYFAISSAIAGVGFAVMIRGRPLEIQCLFGGVADSAMEVGQAVQQIAARPMLSPSAALMLGILIGYLLSQFLAIYVHAPIITHATKLV